MEEERSPKVCGMPACQRKVGIVGLTCPCRCGGSFCSQHRCYSAHDCTFDYKTYERSKIEKSNPEVRPCKIQKV